MTAAQLSEAIVAQEELDLQEDTKWDHRFSVLAEVSAGMRQGQTRTDWFRSLRTLSTRQEEADRESGDRRKVQNVNLLMEVLGAQIDAKEAKSKVKS